MVRATCRKIFKEFGKLIKLSLTDDKVFEFVVENISREQLIEMIDDLKLLLNYLNEYTGTRIGDTDIEKFIINAKGRMK